MAQSYSLDLRVRVAGFVEAGHSQSRGQNLGHTLASRRRHLRPLRATGVLELPQGRRVCARVKVRGSRPIFGGHLV